jgi:molybdopterin-synthase adenylyltransferase
MAVFSPDELGRYARHIMLKEIGGAGQQKLKAARIALVGMGGLGAPAGLYLAGAGVGGLRLIDDDRVSLSNLQRQVLYRSGDMGRLKVQAGAEALRALNPHVALEAAPVRLTAENAAGLLAGVDVVLDGSDSFATRHCVNHAAHAGGVTLVSGAVGRFSGQVGVFASGRTRGFAPAQRLPCYACFAPLAPETEETCAQMGIIGALTGIIGSMMALEAIKVVTGAGVGLSGRVLVYDGLAAQCRTVALPVDPACPVCGVATEDHAPSH